MQQTMAFSQNVKMNRKKKVCILSKLKSLDLRSPKDSTNRPSKLSVAERCLSETGKKREKFSSSKNKKIRSEKFNRLSDTFTFLKNIISR